MYYDKNSTTTISISKQDNASSTNIETSLDIMMNVKSFGCGSYHSLVCALGIIIDIDNK